MDVSNILNPQTLRSEATALHRLSCRYRRLFLVKLYQNFSEIYISIIIYLSLKMSVLTYWTCTVCVGCRFTFRLQLEIWTVSFKIDQSCGEDYCQICRIDAIRCHHVIKYDVGAR